MRCDAEQVGNEVVECCRHTVFCKCLSNLATLRLERDLWQFDGTGNRLRMCGCLAEFAVNDAVRVVRRERHPEHILVEVPRVVLAPGLEAAHREREAVAVEDGRQVAGLVDAATGAQYSL